MPQRILFVTGKLAEPSLRRVLADLAPAVGFESEVAVLPITVAALLTTDWVGRRLTIPEGTERVILPVVATQCRLCNAATNARQRAKSCPPAPPMQSAPSPKKMRPKSTTIAMRSPSMITRPSVARKRFGLYWALSHSNAG